MINPVEKVFVPDLNGTSTVDVVGILVELGDRVEKEDGLITLEGDKASMDIPSPFSGRIKDIKVKIGDKVKEGDEILTVEVQEKKKGKEFGKQIRGTLKNRQLEKKESREKSQTKEISLGSSENGSFNPAVVYAGPVVRRIAREFGVNLSDIKGTGKKGRVLREDLQKYIRQQLKKLKIFEEKRELLRSLGGSPFLVPHKIDFSKFGPIEKEALSKIKKVSGVNLARNWTTIPHVTQFGETDVTELEKFRQNYAEKNKIRLTLLAFVIKAVISTLKYLPCFNASLDSSGEYLILKRYFHIGVAVDTPKGLVVPVIRNADKKGLIELAKELDDISTKARTIGLSLYDMQGGCFSISSLGNIGGAFFTPIINAPEVAILGIAQMQWKSICSSDNSICCRARLMLPLSLSYDHRVVDGVDGARFIVYLSECLSDVRNLLL
ncbi:biotin/lipoyl-binding protein [Coxiella endosymbiont of Amblyomma sculptum]|uniref:2-oxo acid dehydrogenase subunit E2 n=1 Tax=Coxiella endosymbiont of Amblyomma sculptum TaxID=2487929 RepID=UPI00132F21FE|nr:2-oxo acid dehydrogenase subunit E2 [Coxiella endosymbiont of Amblyomma sculptum]QHG92504.1 biotin/lipoyl-binding protein [Coxiella endosymbiont of Amblyomma sculptum]